MRLTSIWSTPGFGLGERILRTRDWLAQEVARLLPTRIRYWVTLQQIGRATMDSPNVPATTVEEILRKLESPKVVR